MFVYWVNVICVLHARVVRDSISSRSVRNTPFAPTPSPEFIPIMANHVSFQDKFYPIRTSLSSYFQLPETNGNNFELKPQFINTLPRFHGMESEDAYFFIREFEEVCLMMRIPQLGKMLLDWDSFPLFLRIHLRNCCVAYPSVRFHFGTVSLGFSLKNSTQSIRAPSSGKI